MTSPPSSKTLLVFFFFTIAAITVLVYQQGLFGAFIFDDHGNIQENTQIRVTELNTSNLVEAAMSGRAGPLKRPIAMLSFALNYYFAEGYHYFSFKITNVIIQVFCAWLLFIFYLQIIQLASIQKSTTIKKQTLPFIAFSIALLWAVHPINLTSVLYIVQRMTSLSTLFTLATLIFYLKARCNSQPGAFKNIIFFSASFISFLLAIFSKENALLIPLYCLLIEWVFFYQKSPWTLVNSLSQRNKRAIGLSLSLIIIALGLYVLNYANNGYDNRAFTLTERVLTEARVLCFYISLIVLPRINALGLFHDDIVLSNSIIDPWATLVALIFIASLIIVAIQAREKKPLFAFGILLFFTAHLMESTIFGLEIAHEHRNHFASIGIIIALTGLLIHSQPFNKKRYALVCGGFFIIFALTTTLRSYEWKDNFHLAQYEASHHPISPATQALLSNTAYKTQHYKVAEDAINTARKLAPTESSYAINSMVLAALLKKTLSDELNNEIKSKLKDNPFSASTQIALAHISTHLTNEAFKPLQPYFIEWLTVILKKLGPTQQASTYHYFLAKAYLTTGNTLGAINAHQQAFNLNKAFINPLFEMGNIFLALKQPVAASIVLNQIEQANKNPRLKRDYSLHIQELKEAIQKIEKSQ
ncbi:tetratricopeptide repeat protein [Cycloclasticus zancles]|uniref:Uncharacterized protein n=1 Tax=Cycloclasticus zancles 78-ME TaxID=1198232 RepID=S5TZP1_9GAMM|nr:hypothetical protein [Cycloclasticus zancles]AGS40685.1 hypothetical protein CYCME_2375 [Cycloclasticus zancles 78-ME]